jgi:hypothetical protein
VPKKPTAGARQRGTDARKFDPDSNAAAVALGPVVQLAKRRPFFSPTEAGSVVSKAGRALLSEWDLVKLADQLDFIATNYVQNYRLRARRTPGQRQIFHRNVQRAADTLLAEFLMFAPFAMPDNDRLSAWAFEASPDQTDRYWLHSLSSSMGRTEPLSEFETARITLRGVQMIRARAARSVSELQGKKGAARRPPFEEIVLVGELYDLFRIATGFTGKYTNELDLTEDTSTDRRGGPLVRFIAAVTTHMHVQVEASRFKRGMPAPAAAEIVIDLDPLRDKRMTESLKRLARTPNRIIERIRQIAWPRADGGTTHSKA